MIMTIDIPNPRNHESPIITTDGRHQWRPLSIQQLRPLYSSQSIVIKAEDDLIMWKNGSDVNDYGEPVRLYLPIAYKFNDPMQPSISVIGGTPSYFERDQHVNRDQVSCGGCGDVMPLLVQLHVPCTPGGIHQFPVGRSVYVFGCNRASCGRHALEQEGGNFSFGGGGTFVCRRSQDTVKESGVSEVEKTAPEPAKSTWGEDTVDDEDTHDDNDWGGVEDKDVDDMEAMLSNMEVSGPKGVGPKKKPAKKQTGKTNSGSCSDSGLPQFACYEIRAQQEPAGKRGIDLDDMEDDNIGISSSSDEKIQAMLARYMAEEEDEEILSAIRGSAGVAATEKDEQLSEGDRAMLAFTDRVKRAPRQVLRYAKDGEPLWAIPQLKQQSSGKKKEMSVPNCPCGAKRIFEFQLMPSLLHVLEVDWHALSVSQVPASAESSGEDETWTREFSNGGQNWGSIALYTCSKSCDINREEFVVVQSSLDGMPERRNDGNMVVEVQLVDDNDEDVEYDNA